MALTNDGGGPGRGSIRSRLGAPERDQWDFETIEYSLVSDEKEQVK